VILAIHGLNPSGGFPSETVQFGFPYRIVILAIHGYNPSGGFPLGKQSNSVFFAELRVR
jgi:hypothetical protein